MGILANRKGFRISGAESVKESWRRLELAGLEARATGGSGPVVGGAIQPAGPLRPSVPNRNRLILSGIHFGSLYALHRVESTRSQRHEQLESHKNDRGDDGPRRRNANKHFAGNGARFWIPQLQLRTSGTTR